MIDMSSEQLRLYSSITGSSVEWLWYPYIPFGKITLIQGDPGCGKSTLMMDIISSVSSGKNLPNGVKLKRPLHVIYQCSEDGVADTIKPRLTAAGADCANVAFVDEDNDWLTLSDENLRRAIADFNAKLLVLDPVQAYLGDADISNVTGMRKALRQLSSWASLYDCAIVLIGHLNKRQSAKDLYRSVGSIDLIAAARSVLQVEVVDGETNLHILRQLKGNLAPRGADLYFDIDQAHRIQWLDAGEVPCELTEEIPKRRSKQAQTAEMLRVILADGPVRASEIYDVFRNAGVSDKTVLLVKKLMHIQSVKKDAVWYWQFPEYSK